MSKLRHLLLIAGFLLMTAPAGVSQVNTAKPGEPVERHLSSDQTFREWSHESNSTDKTKLIKVCRAENVLQDALPGRPDAADARQEACRATAVRGREHSHSDAFTRQVRQALDNLRDKRGTCGQRGKRVEREAGGHHRVRECHLRLRGSVAFEAKSNAAV